jgi:hypothetical protein
MKLVVVTVLFATACSFTSASAPGLMNSDGDGSGINPGGDDDGSNSPKTGPFAIISTIDLTVEAVLPDQAEAIVAVLRELSTNPAHALILAASEAGVPAVNTLYGLIPGVIKDHLEGWINDEVANVKVAGQPITAYAGDLADLADTAYSQFAVDSTMQIDATSATHTLTAIDFAPAGLDAKIAISGLASELLTQTPTVTLTEGGAITFGEQHFGFNYGDYAWAAVNAVVTAEFGTDIHDTLSNAMNCPQLAQSVADKCLLGICVGHEGELQSICQGGLDAVVDAVHQQFSAQRLEAFHYISGMAQFADADHLADGAWNAELDLGLGLRHAPATFVGSR